MKVTVRQSTELTSCSSASTWCLPTTKSFAALIAMREPSYSPTLAIRNLRGMRAMKWAASSLGHGYQIRIKLAVICTTELNHYEAAITAVLFLKQNTRPPCFKMSTIASDQWHTRQLARWWVMWWLSAPSWPRGTCSAAIRTRARRFEKYEGSVTGGMAFTDTNPHAVQRS